MVRNNVVGGECIKEAVGEETEGIVYMYVEIPKTSGRVLARMAISKKLTSLRHEGKVVYHERVE